MWMLFYCINWCVELMVVGMLFVVYVCWIEVEFVVVECVV